MIWLMAFGSATHRRFSCTRAPEISVKSSNTGTMICVPRQTKHTPKGPFQRTMFPKSSRNLLSAAPASPAWKYHWCPKGFALSVIDLQEVERGQADPRKHTKDPRRVHRSWHVPDCGKLPIPSKDGVDKDCHAGSECSELILHCRIVERRFAEEQGEEG